ncbi:transcription factor MYBS3-like isoform X2 [Wolffia australiana]
MARRCSYCGINGHNSRTCPARPGMGGVVKLFGVKISEGEPMKKSASMGNMSNFSSSSVSPRAFANSDDSSLQDGGLAPSGYASDDPNQASCSSSGRDRKKGTPWTEEEHRLFLLGLQSLGKGDWRGIARNFVVSRTPTQVASHAQKYFIRQSNISRRKRRFSLFDMVPDPSFSEDPAHHTVTSNLDSLVLSSVQHLLPNQEISQPEASSAPSDPPEELGGEIQLNSLPPMAPGFHPYHVPIHLSLWHSSDAFAKKEVMGESHEILKPMPILPKDPASVDQLARMVDLRLGDASTGSSEKSGLSLELIESSSRQSAFHINAAVKASMFGQSSDSAVHAL